jgi:hypothetical protein
LFQTSLLFLVAFCVATLAQAQPPAGAPKPGVAKPKPAPEAPWTKENPWGEPDLSGVWQQRFVDAQGRPVVGLDLDDFAQIPYTPQSRAAYDFNQTGKGQAADPEAACLPAGVPRSTGLPYPLRLMQAPGLIAILHEGNVHSYRLVLMNKEHPADVNPTWMGHSVGKWEGETLVIDTVGFNDRTWLDPGGHIHSDKLRTVERFTRLTENQLKYEFTIDDPIAYTKPWGWSYVLQGHHDWEIIEYVCNENNKDIEHMVDGNK